VPAQPLDVGSPRPRWRCAGQRQHLVGPVEPVGLAVGPTRRAEGSRRCRHRSQVEHGLTVRSSATASGLPQPRLAATAAAGRVARCSGGVGSAPKSAPTSVVVSPQQPADRRPATALLGTAEGSQRPARRPRRRRKRGGGVTLAHVLAQALGGVVRRGHGPHLLARRATEHRNRYRKPGDIDVTYTLDRRLSPSSGARAPVGEFTRRGSCGASPTVNQWGHRLRRTEGCQDYIATLSFRRASAPPSATPRWRGGPAGATQRRQADRRVLADVRRDPGGDDLLGHDLGR